MAKFLYRRRGIVESLHRIIEEAEKELVLVSPYIKADEETRGLLGEQKRSTTINVVYGKKELRPAEKRFLEGLGIKLTFLEHLHAKCYLNEDEALLTSMNLYKFSQENNDEMGILVSREDDPKLYGDIYRQVKKYIDRSESAATAQVAERGRGYSAGKTTRSKKSRTVAKAPELGFCIRGRHPVPLVKAPESVRPYCTSCYGARKKFENEEYPGSYCHTCGKKHATTLRKPLCLACYKKYEDVFNFAVSAKSRSN